VNPWVVAENAKDNQQKDARDPQSTDGNDANENGKGESNQLIVFGNVRGETGSCSAPECDDQRQKDEDHVLRENISHNMKRQNYLSTNDQEYSCGSVVQWGSVAYGASYPHSEPYQGGPNRRVREELAKRDGEHPAFWQEDCQSATFEDGELKSFGEEFHVVGYPVDYGDADERRQNR